MTLKTRINLVAVVLILSVSAAQIFVSYLSASVSAERYAELEVNADTVLWNKIISSDLDAMEANTRSLSRDRDTIQALKARDTEELADSGGSSYNLLSSSGVLTHLNLVDTSGQVVFSAPDALVGQSAGSLAQQSLSEKKVVRGIERNANGLLQAVVAFPLYQRGKPAGVAVYGMDLKVAAQDLKETAQTEVAIKSPAGDIQYSTNDSIFSSLSKSIVEMDGQASAHLVESVGDQTYSLVKNPLVDSRGTVLAHLVVAKDQTESFSAQQSIDVISYVTTLIALVLSVLGISWYLGKALAPVSRVISNLQQIAGGDLSNPIQECRRKDETGKLATALNDMQTRLSSIVRDVLSGSDKIAGVAREISLGNTELAQRTEQQSVGMETTVVSMEEITSAVRQNAENASDASNLSQDALDKARRGVSSIQNTISAVDDIKRSSAEISEIISLIDEIAFQTNLLALNAAVEAARAGDQGRGFAVVASEVRALAQRSAGAAKDITQLIETSIERVGIGTKMVEDSGGTLQEIMQSVEKVSDIIRGIADNSQHQAKGIQELNAALSEIDCATQKNTAMVEETAVASQLMVEQADALKKLMQQFKLTTSASAASHATPRPSVYSGATKAVSAGALAPTPAPRKDPDWKVSGDQHQNDASWESF